MLYLLLLLVGLAILIAGGDLLVRGASALAGRLGVAPVVFGMTVVPLSGTGFDARRNTAPP